MARNKQCSPLAICNLNGKRQLQCDTGLDKETCADGGIFGNKSVPQSETLVPFGCPVYVLNNDLQGRKKINKWQYRARVGCYLGQSPQHARTVALVLSLETGLVSPQFHVQMDTTFQTMRKSFGAMLPKSQWMAKCHFIENDDKLTRKRKRSENNANDEQDSTERQDRDVADSRRNARANGQVPNTLKDSAKSREIIPEKENEEETSFTS